MGSSTVTRRVRSYVLIFLGINAFIVVHRVQNFLSPAHPSATLFALNSFFGPMQGFGNALVYGFTRSVGKHYAELLTEHCPWLARRLNVRASLARARKATSSPSPALMMQAAASASAQQRMSSGSHGGGLAGSRENSLRGSAEVGILLSERVRYGGGATDSESEEECTDDGRTALPQPWSPGGGGGAGHRKLGISPRQPSAGGRGMDDYELSGDDEDFSV